MAKKASNVGSQSQMLPLSTRSSLSAAAGSVCSSPLLPKRNPEPD